MRKSVYEEVSSEFQSLGILLQCRFCEWSIAEMLFGNWLMQTRWVFDGEIVMVGREMDVLSDSRCAGTLAQIVLIWHG